MKSSQLPTYLAAVKAAQYEYSLIAPTLPQLRSLCPHLPTQAIEGLLASPKPVTFALPPVMVREAFHIAEFTPADSARRRPAALRVDPINSATTQEFVRHGRFREQAQAYADLHWPHRLVNKSWRHTQVVYLQDPGFRKLVDDSHRVPSVVHLIWVGLKHRVILDKFRQPNEWERAIAVASLDPVAGSEITGEHGSLTAFNCSRCGGGLDTRRCTRCAHERDDDIYKDWQVPWLTPLPPRLVNLLTEAGHKFSYQAA